MRKLIVTVYATLDGVIDGQDNAAIEKWHLPFVDEEFERHTKTKVESCDALLLGRKTYEGFAEAWPTMAGDGGVADRLNSLPKHVASRTLSEPLAWNATLLEGDLTEEVASLKQQPGGDILMFGCGDVAYTLTRAGLVDEIQVLAHPVVVGPGIRLFHDAAEQITLHLTGTTTFSSGIVFLTYRPAPQNNGPRLGARKGAGRVGLTDPAAARSASSGPVRDQARDR
jgi:dihydrofolate reductase